LLYGCHRRPARCMQYGLRKCWHFYTACWKRPPQDPLHTPPLKQRPPCPTPCHVLLNLLHPLGLEVGGHHQQGGLDGAGRGAGKWDGGGVLHPVCAGVSVRGLGFLSRGAWLLEREGAASLPASWAYGSLVPRSTPPTRHCKQFAMPLHGQALSKPGFWSIDNQTPVKAPSCLWAPGWPGPA
jgi:hypothetical protein